LHIGFTGINCKEQARQSDSNWWTRGRDGKIGKV